MPSAAAALAAQVFGDLKGRKVLLVGAGRIGELAAANLSARGASIAYVANRTPESASELAARFGGAPIALDDVALKLGEVDVVLSSSAAPGLLIEPRDVPSRRRHPLFFIDIAVPRDVDPAVHELDGCFLYDIDDLEAVVSETLDGPPRRGGGRRAAGGGGDRALPRVAGLARRRPGDLGAPSARRGDPDGRARQAARRSPTGSASASSQVTAQIVAKLLHEPTVRMKEAAVDGGGEAYAAAIRRLFGLEEPG